MAKKIKSNKERLIVALDFDNTNDAKRLVEILGEEVTFYKVGLELAMSGDYFELIEWLGKKDKKVFADLKLLDISATVGKAIKNLSNYKNINFVTIHTGSKDMMRQAIANSGHIQVLAVTILTNLDQNDLNDIGFDKEVSVKDCVINRAKLVHDCKVDGVISSGLEAKEIRENTDDNFLIVTPGIRPDFLNNKSDDQKRIVDVKKAFNNGADYIVVGRPISQNENPKEVASKIQQQISQIIF